jgi:hypothetical protein
MKLFLAFLSSALIFLCFVSFHQGKEMKTGLKGLQPLRDERRKTLKRWVEFESYN